MWPANCTSHTASWWIDRDPASLKVLESGISGLCVNQDEQLLTQNMYLFAGQRFVFASCSPAFLPTTIPRLNLYHQTRILLESVRSTSFSISQSGPWLIRKFQPWYMMEFQPPILTISASRHWRSRISMHNAALDYDISQFHFTFNACNAYHQCRLWKPTMTLHRDYSSVRAPICTKDLFCKMFLALEGVFILRPRPHLSNNPPRAGALHSLLTHSLQRPGNTKHIFYSTGATDPCMSPYM